MALNVFELFGKIVIDSSGAKSGLDSAVGHAQKAESKLAATFKKIGTAVAAAFSVKAVVDFGKQCTQAYATIAAEESAFAQIMGDYAGVAQQKLDAVASKTGVVSTRLTSSMTSMTAKFKGLGYDVEDATTLAADGLLIASDAAAFWDMSLEESMSHLNSFINGSYEGGEAIGLFANDTQMAAYAIEQGIVADTKAWAKLDEATRQATRLQYAMNMQKMSGAVGQAAKESQQYANVMANLKEHWRQFQGIIGKPILQNIVLPAMQKLNEFMPKLNKAVQEGIVWLDTGFNKIKSYFTDVFTEDGLNLSALPAALGKMFGDLVSQIPGWLASVGRTISNTWTNTVWPAVQGVFKATLGIDLPEWSEITTAVSTWWTNGGLAQAIADVCNWTLNLFGAPAVVTADDVETTISSWWETTKGYVQSACDWVLGLFSQPADVTLDQVKTTLSSWWGTTKGYVQSACAWALGLFGQPADVTLDQVKTTLSSWWETTKGYVQSACDWTLGLFGAPEGDAASAVSTWWEGVKQSVQEVCTWVLNLPTTDKLVELTGYVWEYVASGNAAKDATDATSTALGFLSDGFSGAVAVVKTIVERLSEFIVWITSGTTEADLFNAAVVGIGTALGTMLAAMKAKETFDAFVKSMTAINTALNANPAGLIALAIEALVVAIIYLWNECEPFREFWIGLWDTIQQAVETAKTGLVTFFTVTLPGWWRDVCSAVDDAATAVLGFFGINVPEDWSLTKSISDAFNAVIGTIQAAIDKVKELLGLNGSNTVTTNHIINTISNSRGVGSSSGASTGSAGLSTGGQGIGKSAFLYYFNSHATGLDYVPYDNYLARLHKGEAVLTSSEADVWRGGGSGRVEAALTQMSDILRIIAQNTGANKQVVLDTGAVVGQLAPGIDAQLGMYSNRKGRRN